MTLTFGSLFAGIGGIDLGLERAGLVCRWQVEIDPWCRRVLTKHWPDVPKFGDIKELTGDELERVDVVAGGFPCPPVSSAGKRRAQKDERWLWPEFAGILRVVRPRFVFVENVPGLLTANGGGPMSDVLADLASLGYDTEWDCIPAAAFGAPHLRYRVLIIGAQGGFPDPVGYRLWIERERNRQQHQEPWPAVVVVDGENGDVANAEGHDEPSDGPSLGDEIPTGQRQPGRSGRRTGPLGEWLPEPPLGRVADGVPYRVVRPQLGGIGNAVVPQVAEFVGRQILDLV